MSDIDCQKIPEETFLDRSPLSQVGINEKRSPRFGVDFSSLKIIVSFGRILHAGHTRRLGRVVTSK